MTDTTTSFICPCSHIHIFDKYFILTQLWAWLPEITRELKKGQAARCTDE